MSTDITIIIPTYQGFSWLGETLPALRQQKYSGQVTILAVDSGSTDGTVDLLKQFGAKVISITQAQFSHGYARNLAVKNAATPLVVFMSQDVLPVGTDWLEKLVALLDDPAVGAAHVRQLPRPGATPLETFFQQELYPPKNKRLTWKPGERMTLSKMFFSNVCSVARRELCLRFPFPEDIIMSEDQAFARSLLQAGYQIIYSGDITVFHSHHYSLETLFRRNFDSAYSLRGIAADTPVSIALAGVSYIARETAFLVRNGHWLWLFYMPVYEATRTLGRLCGSQADRMSYDLRVKLSLHRRFWSISRDRSSSPSPESL